MKRSRAGIRKRSTRLAAGRAQAEERSVAAVDRRAATHLRARAAGHRLTQAIRSRPRYQRNSHHSEDASGEGGGRASASTTRSCNGSAAPIPGQLDIWQRELAGVAGRADTTRFCIMQLEERRRRGGERHQAATRRAINYSCDHRYCGAIGSGAVSWIAEAVSLLPDAARIAQLESNVEKRAA